MKKRKHSTPNIQLSTLMETAPIAFEFNEGGRNQKFDLEDRLLEFASVIIDLSESLPATRAGNHIAGQILRSGTAPLPNHGEAEAAESRDDFIHKLKICLKELNETIIWLRILQGSIAVNPDFLSRLIAENTELCKILVASVQTARRNDLKSSRP